MELHQLRYLVAVADEGSFTRAAARLHVAQPGVSAQIRRLERELGEDLFDRTGRSVRLTDAGAAVLPYARAALAAVDGVRLAVDELAGLVRGKVSIGMVTSHPVDLPALLARFHDDHPAVEITLTEDDNDALVTAVLDGRLDAAIVAYGTEPPAGLTAQVVTDEAIFAAVGPGDPLAGRSTIPLSALRDRRLICLPAGGGIRSILDDACTAAGFAPLVPFEAGTPQALVRLAARGLGVAVVPETIAVNHDGVVPLRITRPSLRGRLGFAWRTEGPVSPAARALRGQLAHFDARHSRSSMA
ncbi:LysR family transcriptional regulator [Amycolatopsis suaedae]|uniref:LysR family transcriptional regulator n=1 Tax=Amycolatopsis suaedae TaxID=2510978 RepID=A0A4Q7J062_9PSEU|nr:LysR substrate-binding domain-containing protein [Amycolatopsis suaedae]RZQ60098.1 LysR family transcriptional regulator [Amycolatopsis suaedae]